MKRLMALVLAFAMLFASVAAVAEGDLLDAAPEDDYDLDEFDADFEFEADFGDVEDGGFDPGFESGSEDDADNDAAETQVHATPYVNLFASLKVKYDESSNLYTLTLSKPVDRLLVNWSELGAEPEEVYFNDELVCYVWGTGHKYRPGTQHRYVTATTVETVNMKVFNAGKANEYVGVGSRTKEEHKDPITGKTMIYKTITNQPVVDLNYGDNVAQKILEYQLAYPDLNYEIVLPEIVYYEKEVDAVDEWGQPIKTVKTELLDDKGNVVTTKGYIKGYSETVEYNPYMGTMLFGPKLVAFMTVQGEWAVCYNFKGTIIDISYYTGQF